MSLESKSAVRAPRAVRETWPFSFAPLMRPFDDLLHDGWGRRLVAVEEFTEDGTLVVRAEMPGIDPEKDVEITISDGMLHICAERSEEEEKSGRHFQRRELRYGSFARSLPVPEGTDEGKITASYKDGMLEVRVPLPVAKAAESARRVPVSRA